MIRMVWAVCLVLFPSFVFSQTQKYVNRAAHAAQNFGSE
jgi:hypothetical protein